MFEKIMIISEPMPNFDTVLKTVGSLKKLGTRECILLQCLGFDELNETISTFIKSVYHENLEIQKRVLKEQGLDVTVYETLGYLKDEVNRVAGEEGCSLIVAGASKRTMLGELLFGGAGFQIMHECQHPLLLVRIPAEAVLNIPDLANIDLTRHILFPTDFSDNAEQAFACLPEMAARGAGKMTLMHVQDKAGMNPHLMNQLEQFNTIDQAKLRQLAETLKEKATIDISVQIPFGSPTSEILKAIQEQNVSLVVMGSQGRGFIKEIYLGSVSHNIARHSTASVLLIPAVR